jgi:hypothetical protein
VTSAAIRYTTPLAAQPPLPSRSARGQVRRRSRTPNSLAGAQRHRSIERIRPKGAAAAGEQRIA